MSIWHTARGLMAILYASKRQHRRRRRGWRRRRGRGGAGFYVFVAPVLYPLHIINSIPTPPGVPFLVRGPTQATRGLANRQAAPRVGVPAPTVALARTLAIAVALAASSSRCRRFSSELVFFLCRTGARRDPRPQDQEEGAPHRRGEGSSPAEPLGQPLRRATRPYVHCSVERGCP